MATASWGGFYAELVLSFRTTKMPTAPTSIAQIDEWKAAKSETEHLEFKEAREKFEFYRLLEYCVALAKRE
jgi:hypothetical protein